MSRLKKKPIEGQYVIVYVSGNNMRRTRINGGKVGDVSLEEYIDDEGEFHSKYSFDFMAESEFNELY